MNLSPEQSDVVNTWGRGMSVMAGAGSGKTTTLVIKCAELLKRNPEARFAAVSFTEKSASDLRAKLVTILTGESGESSETLSRHWVMTIHGLCGAILRDFPREAGFDGEESMLSEGEAQRLWERAIEQLWSDQTPEEIEESLERVLNRETRSSLQDLLRRARDLYSLGILDSLRTRDDPDSKALAEVAEFVIDRYDRLKRRRGALDFNDLERGADRALEHEVVRRAFQNRFDLVLVDEFQDTNPLQAKIILRFVKPDFSNLCVVGDPKQSIYRFRDADVSVFEEFCSRLPVRLSLTWNFRSRPGIIQYTNEVCEKAFTASETVPMRYEALTPKREVSGEFSPVTRLDVKSPSDLAHWIKAEVKKGVPLQDMALLLRKIRGNEKWIKALNSSGIPIAVGSGGLFWEDARVRELVCFLKWWANPQNTFSGAVFFRAPWVSVPDQTLDLWLREDATGLKHFFSEGHRSSTSNSGRIARSLYPLFGKILRPAELLLALLVSDEIEDEIGAPLLGLWHRAEELSSSGLDFQETVSEVATAMQEKRREREVAPPRNQGQLPVLTFHGAKGLEFKHVILVDLGQKSRAQKAPLLYWDREEGAYLGAKDESGERIKSPEEERWKARELEKDLAESKRVFYVALTRAQERLIFVCSELLDRKGEPVAFDPEKVYAQDFWRGWVECHQAGHPVETLSVERNAQSEGAASDQGEGRSVSPLDLSEFPLKRPRHSVTEWNLLSRCPRAYEWTYVRPRGAPSSSSLFLNVPLEGSSDELSQRELGTRVHGCLETGDYDGLRELENEAGEDRFRASPVIEWSENSKFMRRDETSWSELAFEIPVGEEILVGSMDRVVKHDEQAATVIDFKVTRHAKDEKDLLSAYETQMRLYRYALSKLSGIREIDAVLVNFSEAGIVEVNVVGEKSGELSDEEFTLRLARKAANIISGERGIPTPQALCGFCRFLSICSEGRRVATEF